MMYVMKYFYLVDFKSCYSLSISVQSMDGHLSAFSTTMNDAEAESARVSGIGKQLPCVAKFANVR